MPAISHHDPHNREFNRTTVRLVSGRCRRADTAIRGRHIMTAPPPNAKVTSKASDGCRRCIIDRMVHNGLGSELIAVSDYDRKDAGVCGTPRGRC
jgi:hypothetical protein